MSAETRLLFEKLSNQVLGAAFTVYNELGPGLLEHCYQEAYCLELHLAGIYFERQKKYKLIYKNVIIGEYFADIVVDDKIILELKAVTELHRVMDAQIINYLRISKCKIGYLINFNGPSVNWKRFVL